MFEKYLTEKNEPNLFKIPVTITTESGESVKLNAIIEDTMPDGSSRGTIITSHGAPGSHRDFKRLNQYLETEDIRVVSVNFPGCGYTKYDDRLKNDNNERIQFVQQIIDALNLKEKLIFLSHSRGSENSIKLAVNNSKKSAGVILVNPIGIRPHRGAKPLIIPIILTFIWKILWLRWFSNWLQYHLYNKVAKLKIKNGEICCVATSLLAGLDYADVLPFIHKFNESNIKAILVYGGKDWIVQSSISQELLVCFKDNIEIKDDDNNTETVKSIFEEMQDGRKTIGIFCKNGSHFLQRDRPQLIVEAAVKMLEYDNTFVKKCSL